MYTLEMVPILYILNGSYKDDNDPIGKLAHDFRCLSSVDMFYPELAKQVKYFRRRKEAGRLCVRCLKI